MKKTRVTFILGVGVVAVAAFAAAAPQATQTVLTADSLRCEDWVDPMGMDLAQPRLSWILYSQERGELQTAYQVLAASSPEALARNSGDMWDSGRIASNKTVGVAYSGRELGTAQRVYWKVRVWDRDGKVSAWSPIGQWTMGVMSDDDWKASWIGAFAGLPAATYAFEKQLEVKPGLKRALVYICGLGQYEMTVNGRSVTANLLTPGWSKYDKTCLYDTYDITALLTPGANAAGVLLGNGMYNVEDPQKRYTKFKNSFGPQKLIAMLRFEYFDGSVETVGTDTNWRVRPGPITYSHVYGGEDYDARLMPAGWDSPGFNDSSWAVAALTRGPGGQLRGLSCAAPGIRTFDVFKPVKTTETPTGSVIYDLGQNAAMMPRIHVHGPAGSVVRITPAELLTANGTLNRNSVGRGQAYWQYTLRGDPTGEDFFPKFFYHGARYFEADLMPSTGGGDMPVVDSLEGLAIRSTSDPVGNFSCSNDLFNRTRTLIRWAQMNNMVSILTDCPHRERLGWLEQDYLNGPSLRYEFDLTSLTWKIMNDMADSQQANGMVPDTAPEYDVFGGSFRDSPEWGSAVILMPWQQYLWSGDTEILKRFYEPMKKYLAYLQSKADGGIVRYGLGDWYDLGPKAPGTQQLTPVGLAATATYFADIKAMEQIAKLVGKDEDAGAFATQADDVRAAFTREFYHGDTGSYGSGSQTSNAMPLALGMVEPTEKGRVLDALVADVRAHDNGLTSGDVGYTYLLRALAGGGRSDVIYVMNNQSDKPGYGYQLKKGATSLTEAWDGGNNSQDHFMLGHIMEWFYHDLAGIQVDPAGPGFQKIIIRPVLTGDMEWAKGSFDSVRGRIESAWTRKDGHVTLTVTLPPNTTGTVYVPATDATGVMEGGQPASKAQGVHFRLAAEGYAVYDVASGHYEFSAPLMASNPTRR